MVPNPVKDAPTMRRSDGIPRRNDIQLRFPAEITISSAIQEVETLGCDTRLTEAVVMLGEAMALVSGFLDERILGPQGGMPTRSE